MTWKNIAHLRSPYLVRDSIGISHFNVYFNVLHFNNILTLGDCVGERLAMEFVLRYWSYMLIKIPSFGCKEPLLCLLTKKWQLKKLRHQGFLTLLLVHLACYMFVIVR